MAQANQEITQTTSTLCQKQGVSQLIETINTGLETSAVLASISHCKSARCVGGTIDNRDNFDPASGNLSCSHQ